MKKIEIHVMPNKKDRFSYYVKHPLIGPMFKSPGKTGRPIKRDDIGSVLAKLSKRILTQLKKGDRRWKRS